MAFFFRNFPFINYDILKNGNSYNIQNPLVRFKIKGIVEPRLANFYEHYIQGQQTAQSICHKYYGDETLDWILFISNEIYDPLYDWPLGDLELLAYVKDKYGSVETAQSTVHHYEYILSDAVTTNTGEVIPERIVIVDEDTYTSLGLNEKRAVDSFEYEIKRNDAKRTIKIIQREFIPSIITEAKAIFK